MTSIFLLCTEVLCFPVQRCHQSAIFYSDAYLLKLISFVFLCRTSLFREALILLNRLASHPIYSKATMEALTSSNPIASLTVDVVSRLPHRSKSFKYDDAMKSQMEAETTDLAQLFRTRVFAFVGGKHIS